MWRQGSQVSTTITFHFHALEKEMATHSVFLPGESQGRGRLVGCHLWGHTESDTTEQLSLHSLLNSFGCTKLSRYDRLYQVIDRNCKMQNTASPFLCHRRAAHRVTTKHKSITVASNLIDSNIFFSCFTGPIKSMYWLMQQDFQKYKTLQKALCLQGATAIQFQGWRRRCH